jgi:hypothetical protein
VRVATEEAEAKLLDVALGDLPSFSNHRIAELTVPILDWFERAPRGDR